MVWLTCGHQFNHTKNSFAKKKKKNFPSTIQTAFKFSGNVTNAEQFKHFYRCKIRKHSSNQTNQTEMTK